MGKKATKASKGDRYSVGFDLGGTKMYAAVFDEELDLVNSHRVPTKGYDGVDSGLKRIAGTIHTALREAGVDPKKLATIGMGVPGIVDLEAGVLTDAPNLGWKKVGLRDVMEKEFGCPVCIINDVDAGLLGEYQRGAAEKSRSALGVFPGTGVGGAFVYKGQILHGTRTSCMEIGNLRLFTTALQSSRGEPVRLEELASRLAISSACVVEAYRGNAPKLMEKAGTDIRDVKSGALKASLTDGDKSVKRILENAVYYLGVGIASAVDLLAPETIVLGGGLVEKMPEVFVDGVADAVKKLASPELTRDIEVVQAKLGDQASVFGAVSYALQKLEKKAK